MSEPASCSPPESLEDFLNRQLRTFRHCLKDAAAKAAKDIEYVHQLRVSSRRLLEAIRVVQPLADPDLCRWFQRHVRRILRIAGKARDLDLLIQAEVTRDDRSNNSAVKRWVRQRGKLQKKLCRKQTSLCRRGLRRRSDKLLKSIAANLSLNASNQSPLSQTWYRDRLREVAMPFLDGLQSATELETIHDVRISGKKFRYALELIGPLMDSGLSEQITVDMKCLQEQLGLLQDYVVARDAFHRLGQRKKHRHEQDDISRRIAVLDQQIAECASMFHEWQHSADSRKLIREIRRLCGTTGRKSGSGTR